MLETNFDYFASNPSFFIDRAHEEDLSTLLNLLKSCDLPLDDFVSHINTTVIARTMNEIIGCAALEMYNPYALLRSVAVASSYRKKGVGRALAKAALEIAHAEDVLQVYLLTETAPEFFSKFGFQPIERSQVPEMVRHSVEFTTACPESAMSMELNLQEVSNWLPHFSESG